MDEGKKLIVYKLPVYDLYAIKFAGGGNTPHCLLGSWTNPSVPEKLIAKYEADKLAASQPKSIPIPEKPKRTLKRVLTPGKLNAQTRS